MALVWIIIIGIAVITISYRHDMNILQYTFKYESVTGTVMDKDTETITTRSTLDPYITKYKTEILLADGNLLIFDNKSLFDNCRMGEEKAIEIKRKYNGEELQSMIYKVTGTADEE